MTSIADQRAKRLDRLIAKGKKLKKQKDSDVVIREILQQDLMREGLSYNARLDYLNTVMAII